jgi:hypothetical protein
MPLTNLNIGAAPNDGTGETLRSGGAKINTNYTFTVTTDTGQQITGAKTFTSPIGAANGAVATPSVTFASDLNTGMWRPAADTIAFSTDGAHRMRIDSSGNVGINATSPGSKLTLNGFGSNNGTLGLYRGDTTEPTLIGTYNSGATLSVFGGGVSRGGQIDFVGGTASSDAGTLVFRTGTGASSAPQTERMRIAADGNVSIANGNLIMGTAGKGIDFSATASAAGMTSELLDDYEEGNWTATIEGTTTAGTATYGGSGTFRAGRYTKVGRIVHISFAVEWLSGTGTGNLKITGLPFASVNDSAVFFAAGGRFANVAMGTDKVGFVQLNPNTTELTVNQYQSDGANAAVAYDAAGDISIQMSYIT